MQAEIAVGVELALVAEYADLVVSGEDDAAVTVLEFGDFSDVLLGHAATPPELVPLDAMSFLLDARRAWAATSPSIGIDIIQMSASNQRQPRACRLARDGSSGGLKSHKSRHLGGQRPYLFDPDSDDVAGFEEFPAR